jgi:hypothetical protein
MLVVNRLLDIKVESVYHMDSTIAGLILYSYLMEVQAIDQNIFPKVLGKEKGLYCPRSTYLSLPKSVPNAGDQLAPLYVALLRCLFGLTVYFRLLSVYRYMYGRTS